MFVDDEIWLLEIARVFLTRAGYGVRGFTNPLEALEDFCDRANHYDIVLTDLIMPKLSGLAFASEIAHRRPDIPIILSTGFGCDWSEDEKHRLGIRETIQKPYTAETLVSVINNALGRHR